MEHPSPSRSGHTVGALAVVSLGLAAGIVFARAWPLPPLRNDAVEYFGLAGNIARGNGFTADGVSPAVYRPPLFASLLGGWFALTRRFSVASAADYQSLVHSLGAAASFALFRELSRSSRAALAAAAFVAVNPILVTRVSLVLQEPTLLLFTTTSLWLTVRSIREPSRGRAAAAGILWGVTTLGKVVTAFAPILVLAGGFLPKRLGWRVPRACAALLLGTAVLAVAPWTIRNALRFGRFVPVNAEAWSLLEWNVREARIPGEPPGEAFVRELDEQGIRGEERAAALRAYVLGHLGAFLFERTVRNAVHFAALPRDWWIATGIVGPGEHSPLYWTLAILFHVPLYLALAARTFQWLLGLLEPPAAFAVAFYWAYWAEHALLWGDPRFSVPVYPLLVGLLLPLRRSSNPCGSCC